MNIYQDFLLPTLLVVLTIVLEVSVNKKIHCKDFIECIISLPKEILMLSMGFVVTYTATSKNEDTATVGVILIVSSVLAAVMIYALFQYSSLKYSELANNSDALAIKDYIQLILSVFIPIIVSGGFYYSSVIICLGGLKQ